ncbi:DUF4886 domain-containing protein [Rariglobus hedericola]|uniref:DUF4886 domain-containing protein n=1 Tax=Rariglobus hedericola TaxID=2597822 RepID=A0A556QRR8_9BACT|nr:DUF4886 domain-containing protein [Rariglobus hedericola]TSJ79323.1 DUF4886 domain-containing protein [Rariglobus hedericola]
MISSLVRSRQIFALAITLFVSAVTLSAAERESLKLLTIGNSFADYPLSYLPDLAKAGGKTLVLGRANPGDCTLARHAEYLAAALANPADPKGRLYKNGSVFNLPGRETVSLPEALAAQAWEIVTIQQASFDSYKPETYHPAVDQIIAAICKFAPQAEIVVQETWIYRDDHPLFQGKENMTQQKMYEGLRAAYHQLAAENGFRIIPSGDAMELARKSPRWTFVADANFDFKNPPVGKLPDESGSLWAGWSWSKPATGEPKLLLDAKHTSIAGKYLGAVVWYQVMFNADSAPASFVPRGLTAEDTADLRSHASEAVKVERLRATSTRVAK